jgi:hypothetical protein
MESFAVQMRKITQIVQHRYEELYSRVDEHVGRSIMYGSAVTGAPGQPVYTGALLASWHRVQRGTFGSLWVSKSPYAHIIEDNLRGATLRSAVGGFHSVTLTRNAFRQIVFHELTGILRYGPQYDFGSSRWRDIRTGRFAKAPV